MAKKMVRDYTKALALTMAPHSIRINAIHPTNVNTDMLHNVPMYKVFRPDLADPTREDAELVFPVLQAMPTPWVGRQMSRTQWCTWLPKSLASSPASSCLSTPALA